MKTADNPAAMRRAPWPLLALNFFMADMQAGIGPFLGVFLIAHGWREGMIGTAMTIGGIAGVAVATPAGALVDASSHKRMLVIAAGVLTLLASGLILLSQKFWLIAAAQIGSAVSGAIIGPAVVGITLGIVRQAGFNRQIGLNQAYNHAGNLIGAALSGLLGWKYGLPAVLGLAAAFGVLSIASMLMVPAHLIDDSAARGFRSDRKGDRKPSGLSVLFGCRPLLLLALALVFFHLGNAAMLPLYGLAVATAKEADPAIAVALTIAVAQGVMIIAAIAAMRLATRHGYWIVLLISFAALPLRAAFAAGMVSKWGIYPVQILDGIGAGLQSVAVPAFVARLLDGTGRVNVGQGAIMTMQGIGAALSPALGGWIVQTAGYSSAFLILGSFAMLSILLWVGFRSTLDTQHAG